MLESLGEDDRYCIVDKIEINGEEGAVFEFINLLSLICGRL